MSSYTRLSEPLDVLGLCVCDEVQVKDHKWLQVQHLPSRGPQQQSGLVVGEVVAEQTGVFKKYWLLEETSI